MNRGIISTPAKIELTSDGLTCSSGLTKEDIRFLLLYWDKLIIPSNNLIEFGVPEQDDLIQSGFLERPLVRHIGRFSGNEIGKVILEGQCKVAEDVLNDRNTDWIIHQKDSQIVLPESKAKTRNTIRVELSHTLPVPSEHIPICEILEFKDRRQDELDALHKAIDELYLQILQSPDEDLTTKQAISDLKRDIENLNRVSDERFKQSKKFDLVTEFAFDAKDTAIAAAGGAIVDFLASGVAIPIATIMAGVASVIKIKGVATKSFIHNNSSNKLAFLSSASSEGIIGKT